MGGSWCAARWIMRRRQRGGSIIRTISAFQEAKARRIKHGNDGNTYSVWGQIVPAKRFTNHNCSF